ncbi:unnamed protein product [Caenorhabditis angaria]|uniref:Alpha N-terminal protein methyltransferase 1 n=1 Tax=Caenorhabditis angaria TaxID=860376 RepID=A0A9P1MS91_9PELO|nr:unnamed protein product [Caenorhabditis angaria]
MDIFPELAYRITNPLFRHLRKDGRKMEIYEKAEAYWCQASQDVDGMLGGFAKLHAPDIAVSRVFLSNLKKKNLLQSTDYALDCGAGIGRVTKHLLMPMFAKVDMVDVIQDLITKSDEYIGTSEGVGEKFVEGLQNFAPPEKRYDLIWIQWVSGHLTEEDLISFFERCKEGIKPDGCIVLKDNIVGGDKTLFDDEDHSWTRTERELLKVFKDAKLEIVSKSLQTGFPHDMYPVKMYALKPAK